MYLLSIVCHQYYEERRHPNYDNMTNTSILTKVIWLSALAQMVACLPLVQHVQGSIPGGVVNFNLKIFNLRARLHITVLD